MSIKVSVIIPAFNVSKYISDAIQSILHQTHIDWELLVVDDGSTDDTAKVVSGYLSDPRIQIISQKNKGVSAARNRGIKVAQGEYVAFLDADDFWLSNNLETKLSTLLSNPHADYVFANIYLVDEQLAIKEINTSGTGNNILNELLKWEREVIPCPSGNLLINKKCFDEGLCFDENFSTAADQDFTFYLALKYKGCYIDEPLMKYRLLSNSMSKNVSLMEKDHIGVYKKAKKNRLFKNVWFRQKCYSNLYLILAGSWWKDADNKARGIYFIALALFNYPLNALKIIKKLAK